ncbi:MAG: DUF4824 family protein [Deltaproteobacteria bacterium]|nr:DUF4824 family protein [Deltaproteobacteria bacterium]
MSSPVRPTPPPRPSAPGPTPNRQPTTKNRKLWLLAALVSALLAEALVLGPALYNRSGTEASLVLTEREMPRAEPLEASPFLRLRWEQPDALPWLGREKLEALGFHLSGPAADPAEQLRYEKTLPKAAYVALEYEGDAWQAWLAETEMELDLLAARLERGEMTREEFEESRGALDRERRTRSRLLAVDVDRDPAELRRRCPDASRYLILPGAVRLILGGDGNVRGAVSAVSPEAIRAPDRDLPALRGRSPHPHPDPYWSDPLEPRYRVELRSGRLHRPWIESVQPLRGS